MKNLPRTKSRRKKPSDPDFLRYTQIAYQIIGTIAIGFVTGYFADKWLALKFPLFELILSFGGVIVALYFVIKNISKKEE